MPWTPARIEQARTDRYHRYLGEALGNFKGVFQSEECSSRFNIQVMPFKNSTRFLWQDDANPTRKGYLFTLPNEFVVPIVAAVLHLKAEMMAERAPKEKGLARKAAA